MLRSTVLRFSASLWLLGAPGCCLEIAGISASTGNSSGTGGASTGARQGGSSSGGTSTGSNINFDAGVCFVAGGPVVTGTWMSIQYGSCTACDPVSAPDGWTQFGPHASCQTFVDKNGARSGPLTVPVTGACQFVFEQSVCNCQCPNGSAGCCGLGDGGVQPACLPTGAVCHDSSNCCEGLACVGTGAIFDTPGYGFCEIG